MRPIPASHLHPDEKIAEALRASAKISPFFSFELEVNEIKLRLDCINRERLDFSVFVCARIQLFHAGQDDNYPVQMKFSGL